MPVKIPPVARLLDVVKLEREEIAAVYIYAILNGLIQLSLPLGVQAIVGFVVGASMRASLVVLISLVITGVLVAGILQINQMKIIEKIQQKLFVRYSFAFAQKIAQLDLKKTDHIYLPEQVNRFFDIPILQKSISKILLDIPTASIQILFGLILLSFYHPAFILFGFILILLLVMILRYTGKSGLQTSLDESTYKYKVAAWLEETARVIKSIKLIKNNNLYLNKTDQHVTDYLNARNKHFQILLLQFNVLIIFKTIITAAMLIVGTMLLVNQQLNIGQFIAAEIIILLVLTSVEKLIINMGSIYDTLTSVEKLSNFTDAPVEVNGSHQLPDGATGLKIEINNVSFSYTNKADVLKDISLHIAPGQKICVKGKGSSGKSTFLRLLAGVYTDFEGSVLINGVPIGNYDLGSLRSQIGVLINQQDIFQGTIWENITLGNNAIPLSWVTEIADTTGLSDFIATCKNGYDTVLDPTGTRLPRTVIHKILLVRALAGNPRLLLLEEPWENNDTSFRQQIIQLLTKLKNTTIVVITNEDEFSKFCDKTLLMERGTLKELSN